MSLLVENYDVSQGDNSWSDKVSVTDGAKSFQAIATGFDQADGEVKVQYSNIDEDANYSDVPTLIQTLPSGDSQIHFDIVSVTHRYYRVVFTANSVTSGTLTIAQP